MLSDVCIIRYFFKKVNRKGVRGQKKTKPELAISGLVFSNKMRGTLSLQKND